MKEGIVYRTEGDFSYCGWPTAARDKDGTVYVAFSGNRIGHVCPFGKNLLVKSYDNGLSWTEPEIVNDSVLDDRDAGFLVRENGEKLLTWFNHSASFYMDQYSEVQRTVKKERLHLADKRINEWKQMDKSLLEGGSYVKSLNTGKVEKVPVTSPHGPIELKSGELLYVGKEFHWGELEKGAIYACIYDGTWRVISKIEMPVPLNLVHEPHVIELCEGTYLAAFRVHNETSFTVYLSYSYDFGKSWTTPAPTGINGSPPHFMRCSTGEIVLSYARREKPFSERAMISYDNGKTFENEIVLSTSENIDIGYPSTVELDDGSLLTVYYQRYGDDENTSVLYTKWRLEDAKNI